MNACRHHVSGFFPRREEAQIALDKLLAWGLARDHIRLYPADTAPKHAAPEARNNTALKNVLVDASIGTAVGTGLGALGELALVASSVSLFIASPLIAPLVMLGWGASLGAILGATAGAIKIPDQPNAGWFSHLIHDAIASGQFVLVVRTSTEQETRVARDIIRSAVGDYHDVGAPA